MRGLVTRPQKSPSESPVAGLTVFFGELSSVNPVIFSPEAARTRPAQIAHGLFESFTGSGGQLCTKPGLAFVPAGEAGRELESELAVVRVGCSGGHDAEQTDQYGVRGGLGWLPCCRRRTRGCVVRTGTGFSVAPMVLATRVAELGTELAQECFGPILVVARYRSLDEMEAALSRIPRSLTTTFHLDAGEIDAFRSIVRIATGRSGRLIFDGYPTGVRVSWHSTMAGHGPRPTRSTRRVGVTAVRRFQRPMAWQDAPEWALPLALRDAGNGTPRRVEGVIV